MDKLATFPIACTLTPQELREERGDLLPGLIEKADAVADLENGLRLSFTPKAGLLVEIAQVLEREKSCCQFLNFSLNVAPKKGRIALEITGPEGTLKFLRSL